MNRALCLNCLRDQGVFFSLCVCVCVCVCAEEGFWISRPPILESLESQAPYFNVSVERSLCLRCNCDNTQEYLLLVLMRGHSSWGSGWSNSEKQCHTKVRLDSHGEREREITELFPE